MRIPKRLMPHGGLVVARPKQGTSGSGTTVLGAPVTPPRANIQERRRLVRSGGTGVSETISTCTVWLDPDQAYPLGSEFTIWKGRPNERKATVLQVAYWEQSPSLPAHYEYLLT